MHIVFLRHGEPNYEPCDERGFIGQGRDFAPLTQEGIRQAEEVSMHPLLGDCQIIVSSPYTRALQTAAIISRNTNLKIHVEVDLHEFIPDKTFQYKGSEQQKALRKDFLECKGKYPEGETRKWETIAEISQRILPVIEKYNSYDKIIIVAHGGVIRRFLGIADIEFCKPYLFEWYRGFTCYEWV